MKRETIKALIYIVLGLGVGLSLFHTRRPLALPPPQPTPGTLDPPFPPITRQTQEQAREQPASRQYTVWATREGLIGGTTASGRIIKKDSVFVALPSRSVLNRTVAVSYRGRTMVAPVWDVGPHNTIDNYWDKDGVPAAQRGERLGRMARYGKPKNGAGIDLSNALWDELKIPRWAGIVKVTWWWE